MLKREIEYWWPKIEFIIGNLKTIVFAGAVVWALIILTLDLLGVVDVRTECPVCVKAIESVIPSANAASNPLGLRDEALIRLKVVILPN